MINLKKKNKNKILTLILAIFLFAIPFLPLFKSNIGTTLAYSSTRPTIDSSYFDYTSSAFSSKYDGYVNKVWPLSSVRFYLTLNEGVSFTSPIDMFYVYYIRPDDGSIGYVGYYNGTGSGTYVAVSYVDGYLNVDFSSSTQPVTDFYNRLLNNYLFVISSNSNYYVLMGEKLHSCYVAYNNGVTAGKNEVINNPNDNGLYTEDQYNQNYQNGYNSAVKGILNGSTFVPAIAYYNNNTLTTKTGSYISSANGHYTFTNTFFSDLSQIQSSKLYQVTIRIENLDFKFTDNTLINVINNVSVGSTLTFNVSYGTYTTGDSSIVWYDVLYTITPVIENDNVIDYKLNYNIPNDLYNKRVTYINITFSDVLNTIPYTYLNNVDIYDLNSSYSSGFNNGYDVGFDAGVDSVDTSVSYNNGYNNGYYQGKNDGILSANKYSFLGLIGAVVDAPIKAFTGLFDFDFLGYNISSFILSLITVCVIITVVKLLLGGK